MPQEITKRQAIIKALHTGRTAKEIIDFFNYNKDLVYRIKKQFEACNDPENFTGERKTHKWHSDAIRSSKFVTKVKQRIPDDPSKSMAALAFEMNVNKSTISRTVAEDLNMKSYCLRKRYLLTAALMEQWLIKGTALLNELKHGSSMSDSFQMRTKIYPGQAPQPTKQSLHHWRPWKSSHCDVNKVSYLCYGPGCHVEWWRRHAPLLLPWGSQGGH